MNNQIITLSAAQLEHLIKQAIDSYHGKDYIYTVKNLDSTNVSSSEDKLSFKVEIRGRETA